MLRHWRKITVTNREQNRLEVYCMDETTVLGEALQETAVTIPYFLAVPSLLNPRTSRPSCPCRRQDSSRNGTASSPFPFISVPKATAAGAPSTPASSGTGAFNTRLIRHERVADEPALQWLRGLFAVHAHREDPKAKTGAFRAFRRRRLRPDRT